MNAFKGNLADALCLSGFRRSCRALVRVGTANSSTASLRAYEFAAFQQPVTCVPVTLLRPFQLVYQVGIAHGCTVTRHQVQQTRSVGTVILAHNRIT